jgi:hypothetical protein
VVVGYYSLEAGKGFGIKKNKQIKYVPFCHCSTSFWLHHHFHQMNHLLHPLLYLVYVVILSPASKIQEPIIDQKRAKKKGK